MIYKTLEYARDAFDYRDIFLVNAAGQEDKVLAGKFGEDKESWEKAQKEDTIKAFKNLDHTKVADIEAIAVKMFEKVKRTVKLKNPIPLMYDVKSGELGKQIEAHEVSGGKVYQRAYGGFMRISGLKHATYTMTTTPQAVHFQIPLEQFKVGRYTMADLTFAAATAILRYKTKLAYDTFVTAYTGGGSYTTDAASGSITAAMVNAAINGLSDQNVSDITIFGRFSKLTPINDFVGTATVSGYPDSKLEELHKLGLIMQYRGAKVLAVKYDADEVYATEAFGTTSIFLLSNEKNFNRYTEVKKMEKSVWIDPKDKTFHFQIDFEDGAAIWKKQFGWRIYDVV